MSVACGSSSSPLKHLLSSGTEQDAVQSKSGVHLFGDFFSTEAHMATAQVEQDNIALVKGGYAAFGAGDMATLTGLYHSDAAFYTVPTGPAQGKHLGRDAIFAYFGSVMEDSGGTFKPTPIAMAATDDRVFVLQELSGTRNGRSMQQGSVMVFTIDGGLVREMREFFADGSAVAAFWA
jgi:ketosteroid isomerase-like protein